MFGLAARQGELPTLREQGCGGIAGGSGGDGGDGGGVGGVGGGDPQQWSAELSKYPTPAMKHEYSHVLALTQLASRLHLLARPQLQLQSRPLLTISAVGVSVHTVQGGGIEGGGGEGTAAGGGGASGDGAVGGVAGGGERLHSMHPVQFA